MNLPQIIQSVLAPGVMISSAALLLLGFQNKFSNLASRFRALNHERRLLLESSKNSESSPRLGNLEKQIQGLGKRAAHVKDAILMTYLAILCFTSTSILIFFRVYTNLQITPLAIGLFLLGMFLIFLSALCMILETRLFYRIIMTEKES